LRIASRAVEPATNYMVIHLKLFGSLRLVRAYTPANIPFKSPGIHLVVAEWTKFGVSRTPGGMGLRSRIRDAPGNYYVQPNRQARRPSQKGGSSPSPQTLQCDSRRLQAIPRQKPST